MGWDIVEQLVSRLGFPIFVAIFVLCRLEPAIKRLERSIMAMTVTVAKLNGMKEADIEVIIGATSKRHPMRRVSDLSPKESRKTRGKV